MSEIGRPLREVEIQEPSLIPPKREESHPEIESIPNPVSPEIQTPVEVPANV